MPSGTFGPNCTHQCYCHNEATCNPVDGRCKCRAGYTGTRCEELCPEGYWGEDCYRACQCRSNNFVCDPTLGCICRWVQKRCTRAGIDQTNLIF